MTRHPRSPRAQAQVPGNARDSRETDLCLPHAIPPGGRPAQSRAGTFLPACDGKSLSATIPFSLPPVCGAGFSVPHCLQLTWPSPTKNAGLGLPVHGGIQAALGSGFQTRLIDGELPSDAANEVRPTRNVSAIDGGDYRRQSHKLERRIVNTDVRRWWGKRLSPRINEEQRSYCLPMTGKSVPFCNGAVHARHATRWASRWGLARQARTPYTTIRVRRLRVRIAGDVCSDRLLSPGDLSSRERSNTNQKAWRMPTRSTP